MLGPLPALVMMLLLIPWTIENYSIMLSATAMVGHDDKQMSMFESVIAFMQEETELVRHPVVLQLLPLVLEALRPGAEGHALEQSLIQNTF